ncbi:hypothetical protein [Spiroplasma endosymbiont of Aspidapion aeneum]|uniref:hypothetical protein n=1 Tax=Spiroplasma endosymbiont of Aspidapion aeneum TaxID=3066276 RepID=UPI00313AF3BA
MPYIDKDNNIIFELEDMEWAWTNAIDLIDVDDKSLKMCYLCKFVMKKDDYYQDSKNETGWVIDFINSSKLKKNYNSYSNIIAIHYNCFKADIKTKANMSKVIKRIKTLIWKNITEEDLKND